MKITDLIKFVEFTHDFQRIKRATLAVGENRQESDSEHAFQLALAGWYILQREQLDLDVQKVITLALVHDLLEVYAGDTSAYASAKRLATKAEREREGINKLKDSWPDFPSMHELIEEYEACSTPESKFVYSLDKLLPTINNYSDGGRAWHRQHVTFEQMKAIKVGKVDRSPVIGGYYKELLEILRDAPELYGTPEEK